MTRLKVARYASWRARFDGMRGSRASAGIANARLYRGSEDTVVVLADISGFRAVLESFAASTWPDPAVLPYTPEIDPDVVEWPLPLGEPRVALFSAVDEHGNEVAGIRLPAVETGVAAYTGWNPRRHIDGLPDVLYDLFGSRLPRLSGSTPSVADLREAALRLADRRLILPADVDRVVEQATTELEAKDK